MSDFDRGCQRAGCKQPASVTLSFRYDARQASLVDLVPDKDPSEYDLCDHHAEVLIVPRGWERLDRRADRAAPAAEAGPTPTEPATEPDAPRMDRYAALIADLPRLAEASGLTGPAEQRPPPRRSFQPIDAASADVPSHPFAPVTQTLLDDDVLEGQLQMPIEPEGQGVVVALTRTRDS
jgi:hypothetical protein